MKEIVDAQKIRIDKRRFYTMITQRDDTLVWTVDTPDEMHMLLVFPFFTICGKFWALCEISLHPQIIYNN